MLHWWRDASTAALQAWEPDGLEENKYHFEKLASVWHVKPVATLTQDFFWEWFMIAVRPHTKPSVCTLGAVLWPVMHHLTADWWSADLLLLASWAILRLMKLWWSASTDTRHSNELWPQGRVIKTEQRQVSLADEGMRAGWEQDADRGAEWDGCPQIKDSVLIPLWFPRPLHLALSLSVTLFDRVYNAFVCDSAMAYPKSTHKLLCSDWISPRDRRNCEAIFKLRWFEI